MNQTLAGIGAMTDFGALLSQPILLLFGAVAQFGIFTVIILITLIVMLLSKITTDKTDKEDL